MDETTTYKHILPTTKAAEEIRRFMGAENVDPGKGGIRIAVLPGGCSGFKYNLTVEDGPADDDVVEEAEGVRIFVDPFSGQYLEGVEIDFVSSINGAGFTFKNPKSSGGCGCGASFTA